MRYFLKVLPLKTWAILAFIVAASLILLAWCDARRDVETAKDQNVVTDARSRSATDAVGTVSETAEANAAVRQEVKDAQDAVVGADGPAARDRAFRDGVRKLQRPDRAD